MSACFADLTEDVWIRAGSFALVNELVNDIKAYLADRNAAPRPYTWKAEGAEILTKWTHTPSTRHPVQAVM